jgi:hypothetical protein
MRREVLLVNPDDYTCKKYDCDIHEELHVSHFAAPELRDFALDHKLRSAQSLVLMPRLA